MPSNKMILTFLTGCVLVMGSNSDLTAQMQAQLTPAKDNTLYESASGSISNGAGSHFFVGSTNNGNIRRAVIQFDVASQIPEDAVVESVTLTLNLSRTQAGSAPLNMHRLESDWGEGTSDAFGNEGSGTTATTNDATWIHTFFDTETWDSPGGDFFADASASLIVSGIGQYTIGSTDDMVRDVQAWLDNPASNFGWILVGNETGNQTTKRFDSKENSSAGNRPLLTVTYNMATSVDDGGPELPESITLAQNYPNPFNPETVIRYTIARGLGQAPVRLEVYNLLGQKINTLVQQAQPAGSYTVTWNGRSERGNPVPSGVYIYRLTAGNTVESRKMTLLR